MIFYQLSGTNVFMSVTRILYLFIIWLTGAMDSINRAESIGKTIEFEIINDLNPISDTSITALRAQATNDLRIAKDYYVKFESHFVIV